MGGKMKGNRSYAWILMILLCTVMLANCSWFEGDDEAVAPAVPPAGTVVQGPVSGATVWADRVTTALPLGNKIQDADEDFTTTNALGKFQYGKKPAYNYINRSKGGTDTVTNKPALPMASPAGSNTVTPITTMVASLPTVAEQDALKTKIEAIMGSEKYDADPSKQITPAALALTKSIESAMTVAAAAVESAAGAATITTTQLSQVMTTVAASIATELAKPATTTATLTSATQLGTLMGTATTAAATTMNSDTTLANIAFSNVAAIGTAVNDACKAISTEIATQTGTGAEAMAIAPSTKIPEQVVVQEIANVIEANQNIAVTKCEDTVVAVPVVVDTTAPAVANAGAAVTPAAGAVNVPVKSPVTISFTKPMDPATITSTTFSLVPTAGGGAVAATITYNSSTNTAIVTPNADLTAGISYTATFTTGAKDLSANLGITANKVWSFTTAAAPDLIPPVATLSPVNGAIGVAVDAHIEATFDKAINPANLSTTTFNVTGPAGAILGVVKFNASNNKAEFSPALPLAYSTAYTATLTSGITSLSGVAMVQTTATFTTAGPADTTKPTATLATSSGTTTGVPTTATVIATFSEQINVTTLNNTTFALKLDNSLDVLGSVLYNSVAKTATFTPSVALLAGRSYTATVTTGVKDLSGNILFEQKTLTFTTAGTQQTGTGGTGTGGTGGTL